MVFFLEWTAGAAGAGVVRCNAEPVRGTMKEAAGRAFHHKVLVVAGLAKLGASRGRAAGWPVTFPE